MGWSDLAGYSDKVRRDFLVPSSGWIGDIVIPASDVTGIWDIFLVSLLFVSWWIAIRTSDRVVALVLARAFDTTIPLQHYLSTNAKVQKLHAKHCEQYWRIWYIATAVEGAAYFLFHPDLFTLVTCFKTTVMMLAWLGRNKDGNFWSTGIRAKPGATAPAAASDRPKEPKEKGWNDKLKAKGYDQHARREMIGELKKIPSSSKQQELLDSWRKAEGQKMKDFNRQFGQKGKSRAAREKANKTPKGPSISEQRATRAMG